MIEKYIGSGPYCYANSLAMALGDGTDPGLVEVLTGSPFGVQLLGGNVPLFDPAGWDPGIGMDAALELLGWTCERAHGGTVAEALERLRVAADAGPVVVGPVEMGLLLHQPGSGRAIGADHFVRVLGVEAGMVRFHDPHGHPFATLPAEQFAAAWRAETIEYADVEYELRTDFRRVREVDPLDALRAMLPRAAAWLDGSDEAVLALADLVETGLSDGQRGGLVWFAIRVGARRLADAAWWLEQIGQTTAAGILAEQAALVGALQYPVTTSGDKAAAALLRELAPMYERLREELASAG